MTFGPGARLGPYEIVSPLGAGGMGCVYRAKHLKLGRDVAIKVLPPEVSTDPTHLLRFEREARAASALNHPAIVTIHDIDEHEGTTYIAMELVEGRTLRERIAEGPLPASYAVAIAIQIAEGLAKAHAAGVTHRDLKPENVMVTDDGRVKILDFGLAKSTNVSELAGASAVTTMTKATAGGVLLGTLHYMSPEQASGAAVDSRSDLFSLGVLLYELLCGRRPFEGSSAATVISAILRDAPPPLTKVRPGAAPRELERIVHECLEKEPGRRPASAEELRHQLVRYQARSETCRSRRVAAVLVPVAIALGVMAVVLYFQAENQRKARATQQLTEIERLADAGEFDAAFAMAHEVERVLPDNAVLAGLWPKFSLVFPIDSRPPRARVHRQRIDTPDGEWELLGVTPLEGVRFIQGAGYRLRVEADGYHDVELLQTALRTRFDMSVPSPLEPVELDLEGALPKAMVRVPGFSARGHQFRAFFVDRYEVTNREFKKFVDAGGYGSRDYWTHPFVRKGVEIPWERALSEMEDQTGRPGPSTWQLGTYPDGQADHPVGGISWYEAAAFARFAGKELPTTEHWAQAQRFFRRDSWIIVPRSNFGGSGSRPVGEGGAMNTFGIYDLVGNVREWCHNEAGPGRATRGGAWTDATFYADWILPKDPFDRDPTNGFRLVGPFDHEEGLALLREPVAPTTVRNYRLETPASDGEYEIFRRLYAYEPIPLNARVESRDRFPHWIREKVTFDLPYGERGGAYLYLPKDATGRLDAVIYWPGSFFADAKSIDEAAEWMFDFVVKDGRAVALPIFKGSLDRDTDDTITTPMTVAAGISMLAYRDLLVQWVKDVSRTIDYLETRDDLDAEKLGYIGFSWGGLTAPIVLAVEPRIKVGVLNVGGFWNTHFLPEADPFHFAPRVRVPVLMVNGEHDIVYPLETAQKPLFEILARSSAEARHYLAQASHVVPRNELIRETLDWLDRHLGPSKVDVSLRNGSPSPTASSER
jgi:dienelactone hydrolase